MTRARINLGIMLVTKPDGTFRFTWNGKPLAKYLVKTDFLMNCYPASWTGYWTAASSGNWTWWTVFLLSLIKPSQRQYLGFSVVNELGVLEFYEFWVLPQGITTAPYIFSRFTLAITTYLRRTVLYVIFITYLDDLGWAINPSRTPAQRQQIMDFIRNTFLNAGWVLSSTKCIFEANITSGSGPPGFLD